jgi:hydrogenase expression/formation protein HypC
MCVGIPMRIVHGDDTGALCERRGDTRRISLLLIGAQPPGTYVLTHLDSAIRVLDEAEARLIDDALDGLARAVEGETFEHLFADLVNREPELPEHLRKEG